MKDAPKRLMMSWQYEDTWVMSEPEDKAPVGYVRVDLFTEIEAENERLRETSLKLLNLMDVDNLTTQTYYKELKQLLEQKGGLR